MFEIVRFHANHAPYLYHGPALQEKGTAWTALCDDGIVACFGYLVLWNGVAEVWLYPGPCFLRHLKSVRRAMEDCIQRETRKHGVHRVQADMLDTPLFARWAKFIGFEYEATFKRYSATGADMKRYVRFMENT